MLKAEQMTTLEKKIGSFSRILETRPGDELTILALAEASFRRGLKLEALTAYQDVVSVTPVPEALLAVAEIYSAQGMTQEAYGELRHLFSIDPENVEARLLVNSLQEDALPPEDLRVFMEQPTTEEALDEARLRLKIQRTIYNRELQERTRNVTLEPGTVIHEYHMEEAKKKLIRVDELLRELEKFRDYNETLQMPPTAEPVSAEVTREAGLDEAESPSMLGEDFAVDTSQFESGISEETLSPLDFGSSSESDDPQPGSGEEWASSQSETPTSDQDFVADAEADAVGEQVSLASPEMVSDSFEQARVADFETVGAEDTEPQTSPLSIPDEVASEPDTMLGLPVAVLAEGLEPSEDSVSPLDFEMSSRPVEESGATSQPDFGPSFDLSVESPLAPDLPDLGVEDAPPIEETEVASAMIDLAPIVMGEAVSPAESRETMETGAVVPESPESRPQPTMNDAPAVPERADPIAVVMPTEEDDSTMILGSPEASSAPSVSEEVNSVLPSAVAEEPVSAETSVEIAAFGSEESEAVGGVSAARRSFYQTHAESLSALTSTLARTRGVTSIYLVAREGETIDSVAKDEISEERIGELVKDSFEFLEAFAKDPGYWVLECAGGIFVMQKLDARHVLIAVGQAGANFGALRYTMDKTRTKFEQLLAQAPE